MFYCIYIYIYIYIFICIIINSKHIIENIISPLIYNFTQFQEPKRISQAGLHPGGFKGAKSFQEYRMGWIRQCASKVPWNK